MYHSVSFGRKNTWADWHLIPTSRPVINPPEPRTKFVEIPGRNGSLDLSEILTGAPSFGDRSGSLSFYVMHDYWSSWVTAYETITNYLHGKKMKLVLEDDPTYYYEGRFTVDSWETGDARSTITIGYTLAPLKETITDPSDAWIWGTDNTSSTTAVLRTYRNLAVNGSRSLTITGYGQPVTPIFTVTGSLTVYASYGGSTKTKVLSAGVNDNTGIFIYPGTNSLVFSGTGTVTIEYREASL